MSEKTAVIVFVFFVVVFFFLSWKHANTANAMIQCKDRQLDSSVSPTGLFIVVITDDLL